jgi:hypothetical protein
MADTNTPTDRNENMQREQGEFDKNRQDKSAIGGEKSAEKGQFDTSQTEKGQVEQGQVDKSRSEPTSR